MSAFDNATRFFHACESLKGWEGCKETNTHYVYVVTMNEDDKVEKMCKIWNAPWALKELGWT